MPVQTVEVVHADGLHARPAAEFVKLANTFPSATITLRFNGRSANGKSIMSVLSLGVNRGAQVELDVQGEDGEHVMSELTHFLSQTAP